MRLHHLWLFVAMAFGVAAASLVASALGLLAAGVACGAIWWLFGDLEDGE